jgi:chemotaxis protein MotB
LVTYADLLTLLMVLFLVLWVISTLDLKKFEKFKEGLGDFGNPAANATVPGPGGAAPPGTDEEGHPTEITVTTTTVPPTTTAVGDSSPPDGTTPSGASVPPASSIPPVLDATQLQDAAAGVQAAVAAAGLPDVIAVTSEERGLVVRIASDDVLFDSASATITPAGAQILSVVAPSLAEFSNQIVVEGHTDHRPLRREGYDNWDLSVDRAVSVIKLLRDQFGIVPDRLGAAGYGDERPIAEGDDPDALARNRRVEIVVLAGPPS